MTEGFEKIVRSQKGGIRYIAVEGPIGVGKTTLASNLASTFKSQLITEDSDNNPFLDRFYRDPKAAALPTQLFFLFQRAEKLEQLQHPDLFNQQTISDFLIDKDRIFAEFTLDQDELNIYEQVYQRMALDKPKPDLVIYLQAPTEVLYQRIHSRGLAAERTIQRDYLDQLNNAYMHFFHHYNEAPLLIVNAAELNLASNPNHYEQLVDYLLTIHSGRHYYNPTPDL